MYLVPSLLLSDTHRDTGFYFQRENEISQIERVLRVNAIHKPPIHCQDQTMPGWKL